MNDINKQAPTPKSKVWIIDGDEAIRWVLKKTLQKMELAYQSFSTHQAFSQALASEVYPQLLIMDESMLDKVSDHAIPTLIMTSRGGLTNTIDAKAVQGEWVDYLTKPFDLEVTMVSIKRALRHNLVKHSNTSALTSVEIPPQLAKPALLGNSPIMQELRQTLVTLAPTPINLVLVGAAGTGKKTAAKFVHAYSLQAQQTLHSIDLTYLTLPEIEARLLGNAQELGLLSQALGGTLFIKGLPSLFMPAALDGRQGQDNLAGRLQIKLLNWLNQHIQENTQENTQERAVKTTQYTGEDEPNALRLLVSVEEDLQKPLQQGRLISGLYDYLNGMSVQLPELAKRIDDIDLLVPCFLKQVASKLGTEIKQLAPEAMSYLKQQAWPGNLRELHNVCQKLSLLATGNIIMLSDLPPDISSSSDTQAATWEALLRDQINYQLVQGNDKALIDIANQIENTLINIALEKTHGHKQKAAKLLGLGRNTLARKLKPTHS